MAKTGLKYVVGAAGTYTAATPTYASGFVIGEAMLADISVSFSSNPLYANNTIVEDETGFESGKIKIGVDEIDDAIQAKMFGHTQIDGTQTTDPKVLRKSAGDNAPFLGIGYYKTGKKNGIPYFEAVWIYKTKFTPPNDSAKTSEGKTTWQTPEVEGSIYPVDTLGNGTYQDSCKVATEEAAIAWLNAKADITVTEG